MRISVDTKATVHVGEYSRGGRSRGVVAVKALDHDMCPKEKLVPGGILEPVSGRSFLFFGTSCKTSDFIADGIVLWWEERKRELSDVKQLVVNLDNGPECNGHRSQFLLRMTEFADMTGSLRKACLLPSLSQQIQWNRALLGRAGEIMERISVEHCGCGIKSGWKLFLEGDTHCGAAAGCAI